MTFSYLEKKSFGELAIIDAALSELENFLDTHFDGDDAAFSFSVNLAIVRNEVDVLRSRRLFEEDGACV